MSFVCTHCDKDKKNKYNLNSHLYVTTNKCSMKQIKLDNEYNINEVKEKMLELMEEMQLAGKKNFNQIFGTQKIRQYGQIIKFYVLQL